MSALAKSAEMTGSARRVMDLIIPYSEERTQFERSIGGFQAVEHMFGDGDFHRELVAGKMGV